jgi:transcriptional regulator GlxA family with amidase domain
MTIGNIAIFDIVRAMKIHVLVLNDVFDTGLATVLDAFGVANELAEMSGLTSARFDVTVVGIHNKVTTSQGLSLRVSPARKGSDADLVVVPAIGFRMPEPLVAALARAEIQAAADVLRSWSARGVTTTAACIGTFVLAESGLLDNQSATTTWWLAPLFRRRYPKVRVDESRMIVKSSRFVTAGAALSHLDLALWLIRRKSPKLAALTAKYLIVDSRPSQSAYILTDHLAYSDPLVEKFEGWARRRLAQGFSLDDAAQAIGASKRTLARRMNAVLGKSPLSYFQEMRVERAVHLLKTTNESIETIAGQVGYADGVTLRTLLRRRLGQGIKEIRRKGVLSEPRRSGARKRPIWEPT